MLYHREVCTSMQQPLDRLNSLYSSRSKAGMKMSKNRKKLVSISLPGNKKQ